MLLKSQGCISEQKNTLFRKSVRVLLNNKKNLSLGDFNLKRENKTMKAFLREDTLYKMMKRNACSKGD